LSEALRALAEVGLESFEECLEDASVEREVAGLLFA